MEDMILRKSIIKAVNEDPVNKCLRIANEYGNRYIKEIMCKDECSPELLSNDWFLALRFWFHKSFARGRKDSISITFMNRTIQAIEKMDKNKLFNIPSKEIEYNLSSNGVNNHIDREMVIQTINYVKGLKDRNIIAYSVSKIKRDQTESIFNELQSIYGIGPKLAGLFLRDVCFLYDIEPRDKNQLICLQPVDTWVRKVTIALNIPKCTSKTTINGVIEPVVDFCMENKMSPLLFNAGAWYVGARSFELFLQSI